MTSKKDQEYLKERNRDHANFVFNVLRHVNSDRNITPAASRVFFWICHHLSGQADGFVKRCWPSIGRLVKLTGFHKETVIQAIKNLETHGYAEVDRTPRQANVYTVLEREEWDLTVYIPSRKIQTSHVMSRDWSTGVPGRKIRPPLVGNSDLTWSEKPDPILLSLSTEVDPMGIQENAPLKAEPQKEEERGSPEREGKKMTITGVGSIASNPAAPLLPAEPSSLPSPGGQVRGGSASATIGSSKDGPPQHSPWTFRPKVMDKPKNDEQELARHSKAQAAWVDHLSGRIDEPELIRRLNAVN